MMKAWFLRTLLPLAACHPFVAHAEAPPSSSPPVALPAPPVHSARPSDEAIRAAVRATLDDMPDNAMPATGTALSGGPYREFARKFSLAEKPHCLGPDPLKHQPHSFTIKSRTVGDFVIGVGGIFALPFWGAAIVRGKCSWSR